MLENTSLDKTSSHCLAVWRSIVDTAATWWSHYWGLSMPGAGSSNHNKFTRDALSVLLFQICNKKGQNALQLAIDGGFDDLVQVMLTEKDIFLLQICPVANSHYKPSRSIESYDYSAERNTSSFNSASRCLIDVTNLLPEFSSQVSYHKQVEMGLSDCEFETANDRATLPERTLEYSLCHRVPLHPVEKLLDKPPMQNLVHQQWVPYQWFILLILLVHIAFMTYYTIASETLIHGHTDIESHIADYIILGYSFILLCFHVIYPLIKHFVQTRPKTYYALFVQPIFEFINDSQFITSKHVVFNIPVYIAIFLIEYVFPLLSLSFFASSLSTLIIAETTNDFQEYATSRGLVSLFGWLLVFWGLRAFPLVYTFMFVLKYIFIKVMIPYALVFTVLLLAFSSAIQMYYQLLSAVVIEQVQDDQLVSHRSFESSVGNVMLELLISVVGMFSLGIFLRQCEKNYDEQFNYYHSTALEKQGILIPCLLLNQ